MLKQKGKSARFITKFYIASELSCSFAAVTWTGVQPFNRIKFWRALLHINSWALSIKAAVISGSLLMAPTAICQFYLMMPPTLGGASSTNRSAIGDWSSPLMKTSTGGTYKSTSLLPYSSCKLESLPLPPSPTSLVPWA